METKHESPVDYETGFADGLKAQLRQKEIELRLKDERVAELERRDCGTEDGFCLYKGRGLCLACKFASDVEIKIEDLSIELTEAEEERDTLRTQNAALVEALERLKYWLHIIAEPVKPERGERTLQDIAVRALQGAEVPGPQSSRSEGQGR